MEPLESWFINAGIILTMQMETDCGMFIFRLFQHCTILTQPTPFIPIINTYCDMYSMGKGLIKPPLSILYLVSFNVNIEPKNIYTMIHRYCMITLPHASAITIVKPTVLWQHACIKTVDFSQFTLYIFDE